MLSCGMFASLADSIAALRRMLALGSPPPLRAATVISRRIFEKSLPRWTSVLPFFRLIWDHRECPDMTYPLSIEIISPLASDALRLRLRGRPAARTTRDHLTARREITGPP